MNYVFAQGSFIEISRAELSRKIFCDRVYYYENDNRFERIIDLGDLGISFNLEFAQCWVNQSKNSVLLSISVIHDIPDSSYIYFSLGKKEYLEGENRMFKLDSTRVKEGKLIRVDGVSKRKSCLYIYSNNFLVYQINLYKLINKSCFNCRDLSKFPLTPKVLIQGSESNIKKDILDKITYSINVLQPGMNKRYKVYEFKVRINNSSKGRYELFSNSRFFTEQMQNLLLEQDTDVHVEFYDILVSDGKRCYLFPPQIFLLE